jgi:hypothetical protein
MHIMLLRVCPEHFFATDKNYKQSEWSATACVFIWRRYQSTPFENIHSGAQCARGIGRFISNADRKIFSARRLMLGSECKVFRNNRCHKLKRVSMEGSTFSVFALLRSPIIQVELRNMRIMLFAFTFSRPIAVIRNIT